MHSALREYLNKRNIIDEFTDLDISITVSRGVNAGATAEITIVDDQVSENDTELSLPTGGIFSEDET